MTNSTPRESLFSVDTIARYLYHVKPDISPLKLQKSLYFLFAYHGALYAQSTVEGKFEGTIGAPKYLFDVQFEAWQYGPVIREVYNNDKANEYCDSAKIEVAVSLVNNQPEMQKFIDELFAQIALIDPFHLVIPRMHNGKSSEQMEKEIYHHNRHNKLCMSECLKNPLI